MDTILELCDELDLSWLAPNIGDFSLTVDKKKIGPTTYSLFYYKNDDGFTWAALYDKEVEDYMVRIQGPLIDFVDISFIRESLEPYMDTLKKRYIESITKRFLQGEQSFTHEYTRKGLHTWDYENFLPSRIGNFYRHMTPKTALSMINGSYIIGTYVKEGEETGLILFYNVFRDEFFGETRTKGTPGMTHALDAKRLKDFEEVLHLHLEEVLQNIEV